MPGLHLAAAAIPQAPTDAASAAAHGFQPFTATHAAILLGWVALLAAAVSWARRLRRLDRAAPRSGSRSASRAKRFTNALGLLGIAAAVANVAYWLLPGVFALSKSLPLHVCDLTLFVLPIALLTGARWALAVLWFVGVGLSSQGLLTPVTRAAPDTAEFWLFWISHGGVVGAGLYLVFALGYRPTLRDFRTAIIFMTTYLFAMLALNIPTGWNYGYVGAATPDQETIITALGPWPWRLLPLSALAALGMFLLMLPFLGPWGAALRRSLPADFIDSPRRSTAPANATPANAAPPSAAPAERNA